MSLDLLKDHSPLSLDALKWELLTLRLIAVDFGTYVVFGNGPIKNSILNALFGVFEDVGRGDPQAALVLQHIKGRMIVYSEAARTDDSRQFLQETGKLFAKSCRCELDPIIATLGSVEFSAMVNGVRHFLESPDIRSAVGDH